jgi:hypothetical protein
LLSFTGPITADPIAGRNIYIGGKNLLLHLNVDLQEIGSAVIGPVNDSKECKPFDRSCIYKTGTSFVKTDNYFVILKCCDELIFEASYM